MVNSSWLKWVNTKQIQIFNNLCCMFVSEEEFQGLQTDFLEKYYAEFDDTEENKFIYTDIHREYVSTFHHLTVPVFALQGHIHALFITRYLSLYVHIILKSNSNLKCGSRGGDRGSRPPPWKITSYMGFYREYAVGPPWKKSDPPPPPPGKCWTPSGTLKNDSFLLN